MSKKIDPAPKRTPSGIDGQFYKALLDDMVTFVALVDPTGTVIFVNNTPLIVGGFSLDEIKGKNLCTAPWWSYSDAARNAIKADIARSAAGESVIREIQIQTADQSLLWIDFSIHPVFDEDGKVTYLVPEGRDITDRKQQEEALRRSQKMDALGQLTGGIAHDYNNTLAIINGYAELLSDQLAEEPRLQKYAEDIIHAVTRGAKLTHKLLAFTRQKSAEISRCNINQLLDDQRLMIEKLLTHQVTLRYELATQLWPIRLDQNDLEDSLINLCLNAAQAMQSVGSFVIATANQNIANPQAQALGIEPGDYVVMQLADSGSGMDKNTLEKIFDPFFTTKADQGSGLGLSQVHGFIQRSNGAIQAVSQPGQGTQFWLYFPRDTATDEPAAAPTPSSTASQRGSEAILIVDDEPIITELTREILTPAGYRVDTATSAQQALEILAAHPVALLISDVIMPDIDGYALARIVAREYPDTQILMMSGFEAGHQRDDQPKTDTHSDLAQPNILYKPFNSTTLLTRIREILDL